jgi:hypothetical protein
MNTIPKHLYAFLAFMLYHVGQAQDILDNLEDGQDEAKDTAARGAEIFFGYFDIAVVLIIAFWGIQAFRNSRANSDDDSGEGFSIVKFLGPKAAMIIVYVIIRQLVPVLLG